MCVAARRLSPPPSCPPAAARHIAARTLAHACAPPPAHALADPAAARPIPRPRQLDGRGASLQEAGLTLCTCTFRVVAVAIITEEEQHGSFFVRPRDMEPPGLVLDRVPSFNAASSAETSRCGHLLPRHDRGLDAAPSRFSIHSSMEPPSWVILFLCAHEI